MPPGQRMTETETNVHELSSPVLTPEDGEGEFAPIGNESAGPRHGLGGLEADVRSPVEIGSGEGHEHGRIELLVVDSKLGGENETLVQGHDPHDLGEASGRSGGVTNTDDETKDGGIKDGQGEDEKDSHSHVEKNAGTDENGEDALPVMRDTGEFNVEEAIKQEEKDLRSEIPDSEADTDEAISPVKIHIESRVQAPDTNDRGAEDDAPSTSGATGDIGQDQNLDTKPDTPSLKLDTAPAESNDQTGQNSVDKTVLSNPGNLDSSAVSFVDDESMIILPQLMTSDVQPTHTRRQMQTQSQEEEVVNSHFSDAVAVMSDVGGGTQDVMSSLEDREREYKEAAMTLSSVVVDEQSGGMDLAGEATVTEGNDVATQKTVEVPSKPASFVVQVTVQDVWPVASNPEGRKESSVSRAPENGDIVMSNGFDTDQQTETNEYPRSPKQENVPENIVMESNAPAITDTTKTKARSIPDSDDDEELPDAEHIPEAENKVKNQHAVSNGIEKARSEPVDLKEVDERVGEQSFSPETTISRSSRQIKSPNGSFKAPTMSAAIRSQVPEPISSPSKPEVMESSPDTDAKGKGKDKIPSRSSATPDAVQNKDVLMAELKAIKIASIQARNTSLRAEIEKKKARLEEVTKELKYPAAETVKNHIKLLHDYNDIRDIGQGLVGMIADNRGVRIGELYEEFGVGLKD